MYKLYTKFALDYGPPDPGCEYNYRSDPVWGKVPTDQVCGFIPKYKTELIITVALILVVAVSLILVRRTKKSKKK
ncbi:hypothetical protein A3E49_03395 [Candidatus Saccharibacteria bacterium RIFCSPHIGHO2_12_FULL_49_19]|nr:MAG: hypothetical protein A3E49_03395 [Candidatus Saccharibacteria bacterium RIFCSPHIGHO2_12_FULL_49_19]